MAAADALPCSCDNCDFAVECTHVGLPGSFLTLIQILGSRGYRYLVQSARPFTSVSIPVGRSEDRDVLADRARRAEALGIDAVFVTDHPAPPKSWLERSGHPTLDPFVALEAGITRLRLLNGSNSRVYMLGLDNDADFHMIGSDGGLLSAPVAMNRLKLAPGERADVLFDLNGLEGQSRTLMSYSSELTQGEPGGVGGGGGPGGPNTNPLNGTDFDIMELRISGTSTLNSIPSSLVTVEPLNESDSDRSRPMLLNNVTGQGGPAPLAINGVELDLNVINEIVTLGDTEIWTITNQTGEPHPFHIHDIQFQILDRGGIAPPAHEQGWKDTVLVYPGEPVRIISRFEDHADPTTPYMYHCHFLGHEDGGMMGQFLVIDPNATTIEQELLPYGDFELMNYPDPFVDWTTIVYSLETISHVRIKVYDATGRALKTLFDGFRDAGRNESIWKAGSVPSGTYFIQIEVDGIPATKSVRITK